MLTVEELDAEILEVKRQLLAVGLEREKMLRETKLQRFIPNEKQSSFFAHSTTKRRAGFCGNRFGKSTCGVVEDCCWLLGERPFYPVDHPLRRAGIPTHGVKILVIGEDWDKVREIFTEDTNPEKPGKFFEYLPPSCIRGRHKNALGIIDTITVTNIIDGRERISTVHFETVRSYVSNPKSVESSDWDAIHIDEPVPKGMWIAVSRGLIDRGGHSWWLLTPLSEPWMYEDMVEHVEKSALLYWFFEATMDDNPLLSEEAKQLYLSELTDEERECRRDGKPLAHGRLVYGKYNEDKHLWKKPDPPAGWRDWATPPEDYLCAYALDPHPQTPHAVLFAAICPLGHVFLYDEIYEKCLISDVAKKINERRARGFFGYELCDPYAWITNPDNGSCWADTLYSHGLQVQRGSKDLDGGIIEVNDLLGSSRKLYVFPHLINFRREIKTWFFDKENRPVDKNDHMMENFRRLVMHDHLTWRPYMRTSPASNPKDEFESVDTKIPGSNNYNIQ